MMIILDITFRIGKDFCHVFKIIPSRIQKAFGEMQCNFLEGTNGQNRVHLPCCNNVYFNVVLNGLAERRV